MRAPMIGWDALRPELLQTGDIVHVQSDGFVSRDIRRSERAPGELESWASHTEHVLRSASDGAVNMSVNGGKPSVIPFHFWRNRARVLVTRRPEPLSERQQDLFICDASGTLMGSKGYGWIKLAAHKGDWLLSQHPLARALHIHPVVFRRLCFLRAYPICSYDTARRYFQILNVRFLNKDFWVVQPDDILDHCVQHQWPVIFADSAETFGIFRTVYRLAAARRRAGNTEAFV